MLKFDWIDLMGLLLTGMLLIILSFCLLLIAKAKQTLIRADTKWNFN